MKVFATWTRRVFRSLVKIFASVLISEIGLQFFKDDRSPFLGRRETQVSSHEAGKQDSLRAALYTSTTRSWKRGC
ncbi:hypothetical protein BX666DRAFT_1856409 [Dichotomocladium elegans]|nr:hypothetical protein BX666DRAFT_1856409 [Dichotomocladium elegans]